jgi:pantoate--beta-alanine ligase
MLIKNVQELSDSLKITRIKNKTVGFVPTMGALHNGHLSLVERAFVENDYVVVSIFVNPTQFNNKEDLKLYPRTLEKDLALLHAFKNLIIFAPNIDEIYPKNEVFTPIDLGNLDKVLEGEYRPGHFQGVVHVVHNLFKMVMPNKAYFGMKDFQQLAVIKFMNKHYGFPVEIVPCETLREESGLAMSSRNMRLSETEKEDALIIWGTLKFIEENKSNFSPQSLQEKAISFFNQGNLELEYLKIVDSEKLTEVFDWKSTNVCCIAAYCGKVRLIDNLLL